MAKSHSWLSPKCVDAPASSGGRGVFAAEPFASGELICVWGGIVVTTAELEVLRAKHDGFDNRCIAVHDGFWLAPAILEASDDAELFNHSCDANAGVKGQIVLVARRTIVAGEEITFDYETVETNLPAFACSCGSNLCRGRIDGSGSQQPGFRQRHAVYLSW